MRFVTTQYISLIVCVCVVRVAGRLVLEAAGPAGSGGLPHADPAVLERSALQD